MSYEENSQDIYTYLIRSRALSLGIEDFLTDLHLM